MAVTIVRTPWIDDDGTGSTGTVINNAVKTALYNDIDGGFAKLAQLAGGNTFSGTQTIAGQIQATYLGLHTWVGAGSSQVGHAVQNTAGAGSTVVLVGNDSSSSLTAIVSYGSTYPGSGLTAANGTLLQANGAGGLAIAATAATLRLYTNGAERMRILTTGEVLMGQAGPVGGGRFCLGADFGVNVGLSIQNVNPANTGVFVAFYNSAQGAAGSIQQSGASGVAYVTTSDARLKDDAGRATDLSALQRVVVHDFAWKADGVRDRGVFAQDAHALYPRAVVPGTDDLTDDGALARPWMTDYSKFVPDLIVGWQQHDAELAELRALLATVKG